MGINNTSGRIGYIDSLKGLSMLMVVCGHIIIFCTLNHENEFIRHIVLINMPLFFFLNGLVIKQPETKDNLGIKVWGKALSLLIPFVSWGVLITLFRNATYYEFISSFYKFGYWYLLVLFQFYIIYYICELILRYVPKKHFLIETIALYTTAYFALRFVTRYIPTHINFIVDYFQLIEYLPYFFLGILTKRANLAEKISENCSCWATAMLILSTVCYVWWDFYSGNISTFILRVCLIILIYLLFITYDNSSGRCLQSLNRMLALIGRHTLGIYMIQFFLFRYIDLHSIGTYLFESHNFIAFLALVSIVSLLVCYICIAIEKIIATSSLFSFILLGKPMTRRIFK